MAASRRPTVSERIMSIICWIRGRHWWRMVGYERADGAACVRDECGWCGAQLTSTPEPPPMEPFAREVRGPEKMNNDDQKSRRNTDEELDELELDAEEQGGLLDSDRSFLARVKAAAHRLLRPRGRA